MSTPRFEVQQVQNPPDTDDIWHWKLLTANDKLLCISPPFLREWDAKRAVYDAIETMKQSEVPELGNEPEEIVEESEDTEQRQGNNEGNDEAIKEEETTEET